MRTVGALRDQQKINRRKHREKVRELVREGQSLQAAQEAASAAFDAEWNRLERQAEFNRTPGNRR